MTEKAIVSVDHLVRYAQICNKEFNDIKNQRCISCLEKFSLVGLGNQQIQTNNQEKKKNIWSRIKEIITDILK